jgi:hypothetical protein
MSLSNRHYLTNQKNVHRLPLINAVILATAMNSTALRADDINHGLHNVFIWLSRYEK